MEGDFGDMGEDFGGMGGDRGIGKNERAENPLLMGF
jgi:hypothetical protein